MNRGEFIISIKFDDGTAVELGGATETYITYEDEEGNPKEGAATLNDERLNLVRLVREAEIAATSVE